MQRTYSKSSNHARLALFLANFIQKELALQLPKVPVCLLPIIYSRVFVSFSLKKLSAIAENSIMKV